MNDLVIGRDTRIRGRVCRRVFLFSVGLGGGEEATDGVSIGQGTDCTALNT